MINNLRIWMQCKALVKHATSRTHKYGEVSTGTSNAAMRQKHYGASRLRRDGR